jgi:uncharacterized protein (DUF433 family)
MSLPDLPPFLTRRPDGEVVITGTRIVLFHFVFYYNRGESAESLALRYPHVPLATVHKLIAFYLENQPAVEEYATGYGVELDRRRKSGTTLNTADLRVRLAGRVKSESGM